MSETAKKSLLIVVVVLAIVAVGYEAFSMMSTDKMQVDKKISMPPGFKSEKQMAIEAKQGGKQSDAGARDLGGDLGGR